MDAEADNISMGSNGSTKPRFKKRSKMNQQEKKEDNAQKWVKEKANKAKAREDPAYEPKPKKPKVNHKYAYEFRFPKRWGDKITLTDYHTLMGKFGARSIRAAMSIMRRDPGRRRNVPWAVECGLSMAIGPRTLASWTRKTGLDTYFLVSPMGPRPPRCGTSKSWTRGRRGRQNFPCDNGGQGPQGQVDNEHQCSPLAGDWSLAGGKGCKFHHHFWKSQGPQITTGGLPQPAKLPLHEGGCQGETLIVSIPSHDH